MMQIGDKIYLYYDARQFKHWVQAYKCEVSKILKTGFKVKNLDEPDEYEDVILKTDGTARGWNTITWSREDDHEAKGDYEYLRKRMEENDQ